MRIPNHLEDLARKFPSIEPLDRYIKIEYKRFAWMTLLEVRELLRHGELLKLYHARDRKAREAALVLSQVSLCLEGLLSVDEEGEDQAFAAGWNYRAEHGTSEHHLSAKDDLDLYPESQCKRISWGRGWWAAERIRVS